VVDSNETCALRVPERSIPVPQSISAAAQAVLAQAAQRPITWPPHPPLDDTQAWLAFAKAADANMKAMVDALPEPGDALACETLVVGEARCYRIAGSAGMPGAAECVLFEIHGGGLIGGGGEICRTMAARAAGRMGALVYAPDYRLPPLHPYPAALDDCVAAYRDVLARHEARRIVVHGGSAGGNLAAALMLRARAEGLPLPAGLILETPELDLTESGDSFQTNMIVDVVLQRGLMPLNLLYAGGHDLADPYLSPLFGDVSGGWPPTLLTAGTRDLFLSNAVRMLHRLRRADVPAELLVYEAMPHGGFFGTPEDQSVAQDIAAFAQRCWRAGRTAAAPPSRP
jgi:acetyl esterase/lipase